MTPNKTPDDDHRPSYSQLRFGKRHIIVLWLFSGFINLYILRACINVAIVSMVFDNSTTTILDKNATDGNSNRTDICPVLGQLTNNTATSSKQGGEFTWSRAERGVVLSSFYYGFICTQFIGGYLPQLIGGRLLFGIGVGGTAALTLLNPIAARTSQGFLVAVRAAEGVLEGITMPVSHFLLSNWAPKQERSTLVLFPATGANIGTVLAAPLTGLFCEYGFDGGWPTTFYIFGAVGLLWCIGWFYAIRDSPAQHPTISAAERKYIEENCQSTSKPVSFADVPWRSIVISLPVWASIIALFGYSWNYNSALTGISTYLKDVLHISSSLNGLISSVPYVILWLVQVVAAFLSDKIRSRGVKTKWVRKSSYMAGMVVSSVILAIIGKAGCDSALVIVLLSIAIGSSGLAYAGVIVNFIDIAPQFGGILMGIANTFACIPGIVAPLITGAVTNKESTIATWQTVFYISAGVSFGCALFFLIFGDGEVQKWNKLSQHVSATITSDDSGPVMPTKVAGKAPQLTNTGEDECF